MKQRFSSRGHVACRCYPSVPLPSSVPAISAPAPNTIRSVFKLPTELMTAPSLEVRNPEWSYTRFIKAVHMNKIASVQINMKDLHATLRTKLGAEATVQLIASENILSDLTKRNVEVRYVRESMSNGALLSSMFEIVTQIIGVLFFIRLLTLFSGSGSGGPGRNPFDNSNKGVGMLYENDTAIDIGFEDVAGIDNAKQELEEVVDFLKDGDKYITMGARIPKGILLVGPPGTGKTLLARAVAGEAGVPFFSCSASEFIELFVGMGASRIRDLFKKAKDKAPCIIFIDEIDAIGKKRSSGSPGGAGSNDEREQTINQLLTEMDGFTANSGIILIAATNRPELLDDALVRPGRFDRQVFVDLPDYIGRKAILNVHLKNKKVIPSIDLESIARRTIGFSGADLENLCNEAAIYAARTQQEFITTTSVNYVFDKLILGAENTTRVISDQKKLLVAYHEAGHALLGILLGDYDTVCKISIVPRGGAAGVTYFEPNEERVDSGLYTREYLENQLVVMLGGRISEEIQFGTMKITTGASQDFLEASQLATTMVAEYGFNETIGPLNVSDTAISDALSGDVASEVKFLIENAYAKGKDLLEANIFYLERLVAALIEKENLDPSDIRIALEGICCDYQSKEEYEASSHDAATAEDEDEDEDDDTLPTPEPWP